MFFVLRKAGFFKNSNLLSFRTSKILTQSLLSPSVQGPKRRQEFGPKRGPKRALCHQVGTIGSEDQKKRATPI